MKSWLTVGGGLTLLPGTTFLLINGPKKAETDSRGMGLCYIVQPGKLATEYNFQSKLCPNYAV